MNKLEISVKELMKYTQQVVVNGLIEGEAISYSATLAYLMQGKDKKGLVAIIQSDYCEGVQAVRHIEPKDISHMEILQVFGGGGCTTYYARAKLNLGKSLNVVLPAYLTEDNMLDCPDFRRALLNLSEDLDIAQIEHHCDIEGGHFTIEIEIIE